MKFFNGFSAVALGCAMIVSGCLGGGSVSQGTNSTAVTGAAAGGSSVGASDGLERCSQTLGTLAVDDGRQQYWYADFRRATGVTNIEPLLRLAVQQSNCFVITSIGNSRLDSRMTSITQQQRNSGEFRAGSKQQKGQRVAADYFLEPAIIINNDAIGGIAAGVGGIFGSVGSAIGGGLQSKNSVVTLSLFDIRSQVQISASEGSSTATNFGAALAGFGGGVGGALGGFSRTPEGKATVAAFLDAYNGMVIALRNYKAQSVAGGLGTGGTLTVN
ncbi:hypothetical protein KHP62_20065 [Rhodobacteraceae bacterium NNCM2]|nr:hypothetical protein [Coraliihabitans acroporae]